MFDLFAGVEKCYLRGIVFIGIAVFVKKQFFGASQEDKAISKST